MDSNVGLAIQSVGVLLLTLLSFFMRSSIEESSLKYWTAAWTSLSLALVILFVGFQVTGYQSVFYSFYVLGEYLFGLLFVAGCRNHVMGKNLGREGVYALAVAVVFAFWLPHMSSDFNDLFMVHAVTMASLFAVAFWTLRRGRHLDRNSQGMRVMSAALFLLSLDFLHYLPLIASRKASWGITVPSGYLQYTAVFDLLLEVLLSFGAMMILMERVRRQIEVANLKLLSAHDQLELMVQMDPLTEALNRHAFHSLLRRPETGEVATTFGCVALIDIDNLKPINDTLGHTAGDKAIRSVARAMRSLIRADDMLFRWGGDEFLVLMFKLPESEAARRLAKLNEILEENCLAWTGMPLTVTVSHGVAGFTSLQGLSGAIEAADRAMYCERQSRRQAIPVVEVDEVVEGVIV